MSDQDFFFPPEPKEPYRSYYDDHAWEWFVDKVWTPFWTLEKMLYLTAGMTLITIYLVWKVLP